MLNTAGAAVVSPSNLFQTKNLNQNGHVFNSLVSSISFTYTFFSDIYSQHDYYLACFV